MPLIQCADCNKEISDSSEICIHCGCPQKDTRKQVYHGVKSAIEDTESQGFKGLIYIAAMVLTGVGLYVGAGMGEIGSVLLGIAIPTVWYFWICQIRIVRKALSAILVIIPFALLLFGNFFDNEFDSPLEGFLAGLFFSVIAYGLFVWPSTSATDSQ